MTIWLIAIVVLLGVIAFLLWHIHVRLIEVFAMTRASVLELQKLNRQPEP